MNSGGWGISLSGGGICHVVDGLYVGYAVEKDVSLRLQPPIGYAAKGVGKCQRLLCKIDFQDVLIRFGWRRWGDRVRECRPAGAVWAEYQIEAGSCKDPGEFGQDTQWRWGD